jgi:hypothetical protein
MITLPLPDLFMTQLSQTSLKALRHHVKSAAGNISKIACNSIKRPSHPSILTRITVPPVDLICLTS